MTQTNIENNYILTVQCYRFSTDKRKHLTSLKMGKSLSLQLSHPSGVSQRR